jgi:hypothetical protein
MNAILLPALLVVCAADDKPVEPKLPLGKDTTFVTGPLDKNGYIDYEAALNAEFGKGITPEKNANALLVLAFGPTPEGSELPAAYYKWLDIAAPPADGAYFVGFNKFSREHLRLTQEQLEALDEFVNRAVQRTWGPKDCPPLAEWLKVNEKPLALALEATRRPGYFNPLVSRRNGGEPGPLIGALLPTVQKCRELGLALACRATLRLGEKKFDAAWQDILACHRLGRLVTRGATLLETLIGTILCQNASSATLAYLERAALTSQQVLNRLKELQALPPLVPLADKIDIGERVMCLDTLQWVRRGGPSGLNLTFERNRKPTAEELQALDKLDWGPALQTVNKWYDRLAAAMRLKDRADREKEFDKIDEELQEIKKKVGARGEFALVEFLRLVSVRGADKVVGKTLGDVLASLLLPSVRRVQQTHDRVAQVERNLHVAFALAAYHKDTGHYPEKLEDLAPKYLAAVPDDVFNGQPLIYKPGKDGYLFYSVGPNGKDDGGRGGDDDPPGDDIRVKMPLPEPKKK